MKILIIDNHEDGLYKCRGDLIRRLLEEHEVILSLPEGKYTDILISWGCRWERAEIDRRGTRPLAELKLIAYYRALLRRLRPDVVLTYSIKPNAYAGAICAAMGIPYIANVTGLGSAILNGGILSRVSLLLYRYGLRKARVVFFQNEFNRDFMLSRAVVGTRAELIPGSGVNLELHRMEEYPSETENPVLLTIGRLMRDKGTDELLEAAARVKKQYPGVIFRLIGFYDGDYEEKVAAASAGGLVEFCGHQDDVHSYIRDCWAVVHPSYHEGMANALLEGASSGRPVIASDVPGCRETFEEGVSGLGFAPRDVSALTEAILRFLALPYEEKKIMGEAGRKKMEREFDRKLVTERYLKEINDLRN